MLTAIFAIKCKTPKLVLPLYHSMDSRKSISGYIFTIFGTKISWKATLQKVVALLIPKAEYITLTKVVKEALWLEGFAKELKVQG